MRPWNSAGLAALATATCALADGMAVFTYCASFNIWCTSVSGVFTTDYGSYRVDANEGCRGTGVPGMTEFCVDWGNSRGHFRFGGQARRCMSKKHTMNIDGYGQCPTGSTCNLSAWEEVRCTW
jgi:hypothetical protein